MAFKLSKSWLKVLSSVLSNMAAGWLGSILILPGVFSLSSTKDIIFLLTYTIPFATLALISAEKIERKLK
jgi:hypothetical protein